MTAAATCAGNRRGVWGPADLDAVRVALERFVGNSAPGRADHELPEQRTAACCCARPMRATSSAASSCWSWITAACEGKGKIDSRFACTGATRDP